MGGVCVGRGMGGVKWGVCRVGGAGEVGVASETVGVCAVGGAGVYLPNSYWSQKAQPIRYIFQINVLNYLG